MSRKNFIREFAGRVQTFFAAAAYAESGEFESAREIIGEQAARPAERKEALRRESRLRNADRITTR